MTEEEAYAQAADEVETNDLIPSLYGRMLAKAGGDINKAKTLYINQRVAEMTNGTVDSDGQIVKPEKLSTKIFFGIFMIVCLVADLLFFVALDDSELPGHNVPYLAGLVVSCFFTYVSWKVLRAPLSSN